MTKRQVSAACAGIGVLLLVAAGALPRDWYPALPLFAGLGLLAASHVLTPCRDQITRFWRHRVLRQP